MVWTCVHLPPNSPEADASINVPRLERLRTVRKPESSVPLLAIQLPTRLQIQDAELLAPQSLTRRDQEDRSRKITWLIQPAGWNEASLLQSLLALAEQVLSVSSVLFVGEASLATANLARRLFDGRVHSELEIGAATKHLAGDLCGYLGPEIILHDRNTVSRLAPLLDNDSILTATALVGLPRGGAGGCSLPRQTDSMCSPRGCCRTLLCPSRVRRMTSGSPERAR